MAGEIIKAEDVRAGDTLRVTLTMTATIEQGTPYAECPATAVMLVMNDAWTIERLDPPLKVGDRVKHRLFDSAGVLLLIDRGEAVYRDAKRGLLAVAVAHLRPDPAKVDGVFAVGDRVNLHSCSVGDGPGHVVKVYDNERVRISWPNGVSDHYMAGLRHEPESAS